MPSCSCLVAASQPQTWPPLKCFSKDVRTVFRAKEYAVGFANLRPANEQMLWKGASWLPSQSSCCSFCHRMQHISLAGKSESEPRMAETKNEALRSQVRSALCIFSTPLLCPFILGEPLGSARLLKSLSDTRRECEGFPTYNRSPQ